MDTEPFHALVLDQQDGVVQASIKKLAHRSLPPGDVLVRVAYSDLNYKDGLAVKGKAKVVRTYPMVPGIDFAGTVEESSSSRFTAGDKVVATGWGLGERHWGGYAQMARVSGDWLVPLPRGLSLQQAMAIGTAGLTAMLAIMELEARGLSPGERPIAVSGASGGVGSVAVAILSALGYRVAASTGREDSHQYLRDLGAHEIISRDELAAAGGRPLESERFGGAVDTVGGNTLAGLLSRMAYRTGVAACGNAGGNALNTTVLPFILRAVSVIGVDSVRCSMTQRLEAWDRLARSLSADALGRMSRVVPLRDVPELADEILQGSIRGRVVVDVNTF